MQISTSLWSEEIDHEEKEIWMPTSFLTRQLAFLIQKTHNLITGKVTIHQKIGKECGLTDSYSSREVSLFLFEQFAKSSPLLLLTVEYPLLASHYPMLITYIPSNTQHKAYSKKEVENKLIDFLICDATTNIIQAMLSDVNRHALPLNEKNII